MADFPDSTSIGITCPSCGMLHQRPLGWVKTHREARCPNCGAAIPIYAADILNLMSQQPEIVKERVVEPDAPREAAGYRREWRLFVGTVIVIAAIGAIALIGDRRSHLPPPPVDLTKPLTFDDLIPACNRPPRNGAIIFFDLKALSMDSAHTLKIDNGTAYNAIVKVRDAATGRAVVSFFVSAKTLGSFESLLDGSYRVQWTVGGELGADCNSFLKTEAADEFDSVITMRAESAPGAIVYTEETLTLHPVPHGNAPSHRIGLDEFNAP